MSGFELNKLAAAVILAGIVAMLTGYAADVFYHPETEVEKRGYEIAGAESFESGSGAVSEANAADAGPIDILPLLATADAAAGATISKKCAVCHDMTKAAADKIGPHLWGVVGRDIASTAGFPFTDGLKAVAGNWDYQHLSEFLTKPQKFAPGTKMVFAGLPKPQDRANLIAYLNSLSDSPKALPTVSAAAAAQNAAAAEVKATLPASQDAAEAQRDVSQEAQKKIEGAKILEEKGKEPLSPAEQKAAKPELTPAQ